MSEATLREGSRVEVRPVRRSDAELLLRGFERLSEESRYRRFLCSMPELSDGMTTPAAGQQDTVRLFEAVVRLLDRIARRRPLLLVLDDLQWADEMSLRLLTFVVRRLGGQRMAVLVTAREEDLDALAPVVAELLAKCGGDDVLQRLQAFAAAAHQDAAVLAVEVDARSVGRFLDVYRQRDAHRGDDVRVLVSELDGEDAVVVEDAR